VADYRDLVNHCLFEPMPEPVCAGGEEVVWWVQFTWAIYYTFGTLVYTSIMAVAISELVVWVLVTSAVTACSKGLAYWLCGYRRILSQVGMS